MTDAQRIRRALVTGASRGIGEEFARQLAARGCDVVLVARSAQLLEQLASHLEDAFGIDAEVLVADLSTATGRTVVSDRLRTDAEPVDLFVNNAGFGVFGPVADQNPARLRAMLHLNVQATTELFLAAIRAQTRRRRGGVINVASTAALQPNPYGAAYGASKAYLMSLGEAVAAEIAGTGVHVTVTCPGPTASEFALVANQRREGLMERAEMTAEDVVADALRAFTRRQVVTVPGAHNKIGRIASHVLPRRIARRLSGRAHRELIGLD